MLYIGLSYLLLFPTADETPVPRIPIGRNTTSVDGPVDRDGYIDYEAALNARLSKGVTPANNACVALWKALGPKPDAGSAVSAELFKRLGMEAPPADGKFIVRLEAYTGGEDYPALEGELRRALVHPWKAGDFPRLAQWIEANDTPLTAVREAVAKPDDFSPRFCPTTDGKSGLLIGALLPGTQKCRTVADLLTARAMRHMGEGRPEDAWPDMRSARRLGWHVERGGSLVESMVGFAVAQKVSAARLIFIQTAAMTAEEYRRRIRELRGEPAFGPIADRYDLTERLTFLDSLQSIQKGIDAANGGIDWAPAYRIGYAYFDRLVAALRRKTRAEQLEELRVLEDDLKAMKEQVGLGLQAILRLKNMTDKKITAQVVRQIGQVVLLQLAPATIKLLDKSQSCEQAERNTLVALALAAYRSDKKCYPPDLQPLVPDYLKEVPGDIFTGKPLIYKLTTGGYLLYSLGPDGKDDGGAGDDIAVKGIGK